VERDRRTHVATFLVEEAITAGATIELSDAAAHHAHVKRLAAHDHVRLTDGAGHIGSGRIALLARGSATIEIGEVASVRRPPVIHLRAPVADRDRMLWLAEKVAELGVASWQGVRFRRSASVSPRGEGPAFLAKVRSRMILDARAALRHVTRRSHARQRGDGNSAGRGGRAAAVSREPTLRRYSRATLGARRRLGAVGSGGARGEGMAPWIPRRHDAPIRDGRCGGRCRLPRATEMIHG